MEDTITGIFRAAVASVKPFELITKNELIKLYIDQDREILEISQGRKNVKCDVTDKKIHLGKNHLKWLVTQINLKYCVDKEQKFNFLFVHLF